jgi:dTDP-4-dehydrorhamnose 3,5-epimerase
VKFAALPLGGAFAVTREPDQDERGSFARIWSSAEFLEQGLVNTLAECSLSVTPRRGTLRGLHYQAPPHEETKYVTCLQGSIWDVMVDLRPSSPTYRQWHALELSGEGHTAVYVPEGLAHGFLTLSDDVVVLYQISTPHVPDAARGVRWDDPAFAIAWPEAPSIVGERDRAYRDFAFGP